MNFRKLLVSEDGVTIEKLVEIIVIGLGSTAILFGILAALRLKAGEIIQKIISFHFGGS
ncbi:MAG: hypothetical protein ACPLQP_01520 [Moorellaceae bacterium]